MKPTTLRERVDQTVEELSRDPMFFSQVLGGMIEKQAAQETPAEVVRIAAEIEKNLGMEKDAARRVAWDTYLRYVNPDFQKRGGKVPPQFLKKIEERKEEKKDEKAEEKKPGHKSAAAELAQKLGIAAKAPKEAEKTAAPVRVDTAPKYNTAAARSLAKSLGV